MLDKGSIIAGLQIYCCSNKTFVSKITLNKISRILLDYPFSLLLIHRQEFVYAIQNEKKIMSMMYIRMQSLVF